MWCARSEQTAFKLFNEPKIGGRGIGRVLNLKKPIVPMGLGYRV